MAQIIKVPNTPFFTQEVTLSNIAYQLVFKYNTSDAAWYVSVNTSTGSPLYSGMKVMPNQNLTGPRQYLGRMPGGNLWCFRRQQDTSPIDRDNLGIGRVYELWWMTTEEEENINIDGTIQL